MSSINKICREYNWVCKHIKGPLYRIKMQELYIEVNKAMKDPGLTPEQKLKTNRYQGYHKVKAMKMFELIPYILELDPETEIKLIEDLEPGKDGLPKMSKVLPTMMVNTKTGEKVLTLIKESHMKEFMLKAELMSAHNVQLKDKVS